MARPCLDAAVGRAGASAVRRHGDRSAAARLRAAVARAMRAAAVTPLLAYSKLISPSLPRRCRYEPTCSAYALEAVRQFGILRGFTLGTWRLLRCNPFSDGGYDPVEEQRLFRRDRHADA